MDHQFPIQHYFKIILSLGSKRGMPHAYSKGKLFGSKLNITWRLAELGSGAWICGIVNIYPGY
jgi:hypothetical protein